MPVRWEPLQVCVFFMWSLYVIFAAFVARPSIWPAIDRSQEMQPRKWETK